MTTDPASTAVVAGVEVDTRHWIGGRRVASATTFEDVSPLDGTVIARGQPRRPGRGRRGGRRRQRRVRRLVADLAGRARRDPQPGRRRRRGAHRGPRAGRDARQRLAAALAPPRGHAARGDEHPLLRRPPARAEPPRLRHPRPPQPRLVGPGRRHRDRHAVERAAHARDLAHRPGARRGQHGGREAAGVGAAHRVALRRHRARGGPARRRLQRRAGSRHRGGRAARRAPGRAPHLLHRLGADVGEDRRVGGAQRDAGELRARRQVAAARVRRRRPRPRGRPRGRAVRQLRPGLPRRGPHARPGQRSTTSSARGSSRRRRPSRRATRATRPPTSARS